MHTDDDNTMNHDEVATHASTTESTEVTLGKGLDIGTANLAAAVQNEEDAITVTVERNAFLDIGDDVYSKNMLTKLKVPYVVHNGKFLVLGESAFELANVFGKETRRPMKDGAARSSCFQSRRGELARAASQLSRPVKPPPAARTSQASNQPATGSSTASTSSAATSIAHGSNCHAGAACASRASAVKRCGRLPGARHPRVSSATSSGTPNSNSATT